MRTALITGARRGIGRAIAEKFLAEGWFVVGTSTEAEVGLANQNLVAIQLDLSQKDSIATAAEEVRKLDRAIDVLVNNAGVAYEESGNGVEMDILRKTLEVNLLGLVDFTNRIIPLMPDGSHIVNVSSQAGALTTFESLHWMVPSYKISKSALNMYTQVLGELLTSRKVTVSSLDPGWVQTDMGGDEATRKPDEPAKEVYELVTGPPIATGKFWHKGSERTW